MATQAAVASSATSVALLAAGSKRNRIIIENSDANRLHVLVGGGTATATQAYSFSLAQYEKATIDTYGGAISGIWAADGAGHALVTVY